MRTCFVAVTLLLVALICCCCSGIYADPQVTISAYQGPGLCGSSPSSQVTVPTKTCLQDSDYGTIYYCDSSSVTVFIYIDTSCSDLYSNSTYDNGECVKYSADDEVTYQCVE